MRGGPPDELESGPAPGVGPRDDPNLRPIADPADIAVGSDDAPQRGDVLLFPDGTTTVINARLGQTPEMLGAHFALGVHYPDVFEHDHERRQAALLGESYDVRALEAAHWRTDGHGNPDILLRDDGTDPGSYGDLKRLDPRKPPNPKDPDYSRRLETQLRDAFSQDPRISVAVVDGRDVGLTIDGAVRGIRRALGYWRHRGREITSAQRMMVLVGDGSWVVWRGDTGAINVSA